jgi:hypothetical protein
VWFGFQQPDSILWSAKEKNPEKSQITTGIHNILKEGFKEYAKT